MRAVYFFLAGLAVTAGLSALGPVPLAFADKSGPPTTYTKASADGQYIFVMISPNEVDAELKLYNDEAAKKVRAIRAMYTRSGLYKNDGSKEPLWTVDWYAAGVLVPSDGVHLVRFQYMPFYKAPRGEPVDKEGLKTEGVTFFAKGKEIRKYQVADLIERPELLTRSVVHYQWVKAPVLRDKEGQLEIVTLDGNRFVFELKTGEIVKKERANPKE
ncbi:MAG TPA: hypothetical protein VKE74_14610 [Gemmataceae bacterium]|nr:hypothetical protein [Gemmataceae bacterium]